MPTVHRHDGEELTMPTALEVIGYGFALALALLIVGIVVLALVGVGKIVNDAIQIEIDKARRARGDDTKEH